jgi:hypothetical protein
MEEGTSERINHLTNVMKKAKKFHQRYPSKLKSFLVEFVAKNGGDVIDANIRHHLIMDGIHS